MPDNQAFQCPAIQGKRDVRAAGDFSIDHPRNGLCHVVQGDSRNRARRMDEGEGQGRRGQAPQKRRAAEGIAAYDEGRAQDDMRQSACRERFIGRPLGGKKCRSTRCTGSVGGDLDHHLQAGRRCRLVKGALRPCLYIHQPVIEPVLQCAGAIDDDILVLEERLPVLGCQEVCEIGPDPGDLRHARGQPRGVATEAGDVMAFGSEPCRNMRADKAGCAQNQDVHGPRLGPHGLQSKRDG